MRATSRLKGMNLSDVPGGVSLLSVAVFRLSRAIKSQISQVVSHDESIGLVAWRVLMGLSLVENATQRELVAFTRMQQAQVSRALKDMTRHRLIASTPSETDKRVKKYSLTYPGRQKHAALLPMVSGLTGAIDGALSLAEQSQFLDMCARIEWAAQAGECISDRTKFNPNTKSVIVHQEERT